MALVEQVQDFCMALVEQVQDFCMSLEEQVQDDIYWYVQLVFAVTQI